MQHVASWLHRAHNRSSDPFSPCHVMADGVVMMSHGRRTVPQPKRKQDTATWLHAFVKTERLS